MVLSLQLYSLNLRRQIAINMKRIFAILISVISLSICHKALAQDDVYLVPNPQTARWSYIETDSNGKKVSTIYNSIESIEGNAVNGKIKMRIEEVPVGSPKDTVKSFILYRFKDGEFMVDMNAMFEGDILATFVGDAIAEEGSDVSEKEMKEAIEKVKSQFKITGEIRGIPRYPEVGPLPDYEFQFKVSVISMSVSGENRRIVGTERIQTEAGSFDCFILEETLTTKAMMVKDVERTKSWYAYGIGMVKEITYDKNGKLISTMVLNEINW